VLQAEISKDGTIQNLQLISGHPMLAPAAIEAVTAVALQALPAQMRAGGGGDAGGGEL